MLNSCSKRLHPFGSFQNGWASVNEEEYLQVDQSFKFKNEGSFPNLIVDGHFPSYKERPHLYI